MCRICIHYRSCVRKIWCVFVILYGTSKFWVITFLTSWTRCATFCSIQIASFIKLCYFWSGNVMFWLKGELRVSTDTASSNACLGALVAYMRRIEGLKSRYFVWYLNHLHCTHRKNMMHNISISSDLHIFFSMRCLNLNTLFGGTHELPSYMATKIWQYFIEQPLSYICISNHQLGFDFAPSMTVKYIFHWPHNTLLSIVSRHAYEISAIWICYNNNNNNNNDNNNISIIIIIIIISYIVIKSYICYLQQIIHFPDTSWYLIMISYSTDPIAIRVS